ncbi:TAXI family TRAP transporter solute-binding subunit [Robertmurraya yapensis]|uniref:TAXI family TRAP transporter solute-binding subunit n=2 Tax=Bacillaceae TaxID=186817 RepID=A0A3S0IRN7_9BACI|nr:TAXI family TRAP transporter solute-binding subunit [Bacillus yapensis]RTR29953.1 TAXI family TRAP transporter solute-binding subunit [Bacillus yapensis]TKS95034.1 TAXI family TRAP transporter solute-binding subunit [Bacillus yapensis]
MFTKERIIKLSLSGLIFITFAYLAGCSSSAAGKDGGTNQLKIVTATTTGAYYPVGGVMASILSEMEGYNFTAEASGGSQENARLMDSKQAQIGFLGSDSSYNAYNGLESFEGKAIELAGLAQIYSMPFHVVVLKGSGIESMEDLKGKTVAVGAPGSGTSGKAKIILEEFGLPFEKEIKAEYLNFTEGAEALIDGNVDAVIISVGLPSGNIQELATSHEIELLPFEKEKISKLIEKYPYFRETQIPGRTYKGIDEDVTVVSVPTDIVVAPDLDEELVYNMTKMLYDTHYDQFINSHASMKESTLEIAPYTSVPLHPGAEKFYKEKGVLK